MDTSNKPKTIASIDINIHIPAVDKRAWVEESLTDLLQCVLCGTDLEFVHKTDFIAESVTENAHCPSCNICNRQTTHSLL